MQQYTIAKDILFLNLNCMLKQINLILLDFKNNYNINYKSINCYNAFQKIAKKNNYTKYFRLLIANKLQSIKTRYFI